MREFKEEWQTFIRNSKILDWDRLYDAFCDHFENDEDAQGIIEGNDVVLGNMLECVIKWEISNK